MPTICIGSLKDIEGCNCNLFIPRKSKKNKCKSCGHQKVSHSDIPTTPPPRGTKVDTTAMAKPQGHSKYTDRLYKSLKATAVHEDARKETLQGFRPPSPPTMPGVSSVKGKGKGKARQVSSQAVPKTVKFGRIMFFPCGDQNIGWFNFPTINSTVLQPWVNAGLTIEADKSAFVFQLNWGTKQLNAFLCTLLPGLFAYFDSVTPGFRAIQDEPDDIGTKRIDYSLPYILLHKIRKKYFVVDEAHPIGAMYKDNLAGDQTKGAGFRAKSLFLVTREPIPQSVLNDWFAPSLAPIVPIAPVTSQEIAAGKKRARADSISLSSDSEDSGNSRDTVIVDDEETETDNIKIIEKPPKKRIRRSSPRSQDSPSPQFVEGSSKVCNQDLDGLAQQLQYSASFEEDRNGVWVNDEEADLWNF